MKVNSNRDISFRSVYNSRALKHGLEFASDNSALFAATTTLAMSAIVRPTAIWLAPHTDKENKKVACSKSIASSSVGFALTYILATPFAKAIKKIDKNPQKYLKSKTINFLKDGSPSLVQSKKYTLATQLFKLGLGLAVAAPKGFFTCAMLPYVLQNLFKKPIPNKKKNDNKKSENINFKGKKNETLAKNIGKLLDKSFLQKFSEKFKNSNFPMHMVAATDIITTSTFIHETYKSHKVEQKRKKALIYNAGFSTGLSVISSYIVDRLMDKPTQKFIENFKKANKNGKNLDKQIEGIKIAKPILLMGCVYYMFIPFVSTFLAELADHSPKFDIPDKKSEIS